MLRFLSLITIFIAIDISVSGDTFEMTKNLPRMMRAVGLYKYLPISESNSLLDVEVPLPTVNNNDVLVKVKATAVNPIDTKLRAPKPTVEATPRILGFDGSGVVVAKGEQTKLFNIGDEVYFTGDFRRTGSNAEYVALDEVLVALKPKKLTFEQAAAIPLTGVTAYESLFDRLLITKKDAGKSLLIINSAGGVGSVASQLAKNIGLSVIGTASRKETEEFSLANGADIVLNHTKDLIPQLEANGYKDGVDFILVNYDPFPYWHTLMKASKAQGKICLIVDSSGLVDLKPLKTKSLTLVSEMMLTRVIFDTDDKYRHHEILDEISKMLDNGQLNSTLTKVLSPINAANMKEAHKLLEEKRTIGKIVVTGFGDK